MSVLKFYLSDPIPLVIDSENSNVPILLNLPGEGKIVSGQGEATSGIANYFTILD